MTMEEFRKAGGVLDGRPELCDTFAGEPQIAENGGANQTHPNAYIKGQKIGTTRPGPTRMMSGSEERVRESGRLREGMRTPPIGAR